MMPSNPIAAAAAACLLSAAPGWAQDDASYAADWPDDRKIENALSAMPAFMRADPRVWDWQVDGDGAFVVLRAGTSDWTCFPDRAETPGNDPMCHDPVFLEWLLANAAGREPEIERVGLSYMLQGGAAFTQDSPFVTGPLDSDEWYFMGPHVMVVLPDAADWEGVNRDSSRGHPMVEALALDNPILLFPVAGPDEALEVVPQ